MKINPPRAPIASDTIRYALMHLTEACACVTLLLGKVALHAGHDRLILLTIFFNALAIGGRVTVSLLADRVTNRRTGVLLGVMLFFLGFFWPPQLGVTVAVSLAAMGSAVFHAFSASSVMAASAFGASGMGLLMGCAALGTALGVHTKFFGYPAILLFVILACPSDENSDTVSLTEHRLPWAPKTEAAPLFAVLLFSAVTLASYLLSSLNLSAGADPKTLLLLALAVTVGRAVGGFISDRFGSIPLLTLSLGGGGLILAFFAHSGRLFVLAGLLLFSLSASPMLSLLHRFLPASPAFAASLFAGAAYLGYTAVKLDPMKKSLTLPFALIVLGLCLAAEIYLTRKARHQDQENEPEQEVLS
ncbi:MAG: hypothetical protein IJD10_02580 [Clostridia bacterium]|nr:hypothetical protein [Clostridia bacterium]